MFENAAVCSSMGIVGFFHAQISFVTIMEVITIIIWEVSSSPTVKRTYRIERHIAHDHYGGATEKLNFLWSFWRAFFYYLCIEWNEWRKKTTTNKQRRFIQIRSECNSTASLNPTFRRFHLLCTKNIAQYNTHTSQFLNLNFLPQNVVP